jgi:hypothetical protein
LSPQILVEEMHTEILWEREGVGTYTPFLIKGSKGNGHGSEAISGPWDNEQPSPLIWAERPLGHNALNHTKKTRVSLTPEM